MATLWLTQEQLDQAFAKVEKLESINDVIWITVQPLKDNHKHIGTGPTLPQYKTFELRFRRVIREETIIPLVTGAKIHLAKMPGWELDSTVQVVPEWLARIMQETDD